MPRLRTILAFVIAPLAIPIGLAILCAAFPGPDPVSFTGFFGLILLYSIFLPCHLPTCLNSLSAFPFGCSSVVAEFANGTSLLRAAPCLEHYTGSSSLYSPSPPTLEVTTYIHIRSQGTGSIQWHSGSTCQQVWCQRCCFAPSSFHGAHNKTLSPLLRKETTCNHRLSRRVPGAHPSPRVCFYAVIPNPRPRFWRAA